MEETNESGCHQPVESESMRKIFNRQLSFQLFHMAAAAYAKVPEINDDNAIELQKQCIQRGFPTGGWTHVGLHGAQCGGARCSFFVAKSDQEKALIIAFRGTFCNQQLIAEVQAGRFPKMHFPRARTLGLRMLNGRRLSGHRHMYWGLVHSYFGDALYRLWPKIREEIMKYPDYKLILTGHSLGGALAAMTAAQTRVERLRRSNQIVLYTFGEPRVGNSDFARLFDMEIPISFRVVNKNDLVVRLPPCQKVRVSEKFRKCYHRQFYQALPTDVMCRPSKRTFYHHGTEVWWAKGMSMDWKSRWKLSNLPRTCTKNPQGEDISCSSAVTVGMDIFQQIKDHQYYYGVSVFGFGQQGCNREKAEKMDAAKSQEEIEEDVLTEMEIPRDELANIAKIISDQEKDVMEEQNVDDQMEKKAHQKMDDGQYGNGEKSADDNGNSPPARVNQMKRKRNEDVPEGEQGEEQPGGEAEQQQTTPATRIMLVGKRQEPPQQPVFGSVLHQQSTLTENLLKALRDGTVFTKNIADEMNNEMKKRKNQPIWRDQIESEQRKARERQFQMQWELNNKWSNPTAFSTALKKLPMATMQKKRNDQIAQSEKNKEIDADEYKTDEAKHKDELEERIEIEESHVDGNDENQMASTSTTPLPNDLDEQHPQRKWQTMEEGMANENPKDPDNELLIFAFDDDLENVGKTNELQNEAANKREDQIEVPKAAFETPSVNNGKDEKADLAIDPKTVHSDEQQTQNQKEPKVVEEKIPVNEANQMPTLGSEVHPIGETGNEDDAIGEKAKSANDEKAILPNKAADQSDLQQKEPEIADEKKMPPPSPNVDNGGNAHTRWIKQMSAYEQIALNNKIRVPAFPLTSWAHINSVPRPSTSAIKYYHSVAAVNNNNNPFREDNALWANSWRPMLPTKMQPTAVMATPSPSKWVENAATEDESKKATTGSFTENFLQSLKNSFASRLSKSPMKVAEMRSEMIGSTQFGNFLKNVWGLDRHNPFNS